MLIRSEGRPGEAVAGLGFCFECPLLLERNGKSHRESHAPPPPLHLPAPAPGGSLGPAQNDLVGGHPAQALMCCGTRDIAGPVLIGTGPNHWRSASATSATSTVAVSPSANCSCHPSPGGASSKTRRIPRQALFESMAPDCRRSGPAFQYRDPSDTRPWMSDH